MNKNLFNILITMILVVSIFQVQSVSASYKKNIGDSCILDAECQSGWCINDKCVVNPCTDGKCDLLVDCHECTIVNGKMGDCSVASCGFETSECYDGICNPYTDCFCVDGGDCDAFQCKTNGLLNNMSAIGLLVGFVFVIIGYNYVHKKTKRR